MCFRVDAYHNIFVQDAFKVAAKSVQFRVHLNLERQGSVAIVVNISAERVFKRKQGLGRGKIRAVLKMNDVRRLVVGQGILVQILGTPDLVEDLGRLKRTNLKKTGTNTHTKYQATEIFGKKNPRRVQPYP